MMDSAQHDLTKNDTVKKLALIVDDSSTARQLLKKLLVSYGHEVLCADSAELAIQMLNQTDQAHPDVIFMDHNMPGMDGLQALKTIKTNPRTAMIPILMYTSQGDSVYAEQAKRFGAVGIIPKELKHVALKEVLDTLDKIITRSKQGDHEFNENNFPETGPTLTESVPQLKQAPIHLHTEQSKTASSPVSQAITTKPRSRSSIELENTETVLEKSLADGNKESKFATAPPQFNHEENAETPHKRLLMDSIKLIQQQNHDIQSQMSRAHRHFQQNLSKMKKWVMLITFTLLAVNLLSWLNPLATLDRSAVVTQQPNSQPSQVFRSSKDASVTINNKIKEAFASNHEQTQLQQQLPLLQNLINQGVPFNFNAPPFNDLQAKAVENLLKLLPTIGFSGTIQLTAFFTDFCVTEQGGSWELANDNLPIEQCQFFSIESMGYSELQSLGFSNLLGSANPQQEINISVTVQEDSTDGSNKPERNSVKTAGSWNQLIARYNRVEYQLIQDTK